MNGKGLKASAIRKILKDPKKIKKLTQAAFDEVDADGNGYLDRDELKTVMMNIAQDIGVDTPSEDEVADVLKELDDNDDGQISVEEFEVLIRQVLEVMARSEEEEDAW